MWTLNSFELTLLRRCFCTLRHYFTLDIVASGPDLQLSACVGIHYDLTCFASAFRSCSGAALSLSLSRQLPSRILRRCSGTGRVFLIT